MAIGLSRQQVVTWVIEASALIGGVSFVVSATLHTVVFAFWGLSYHQIATTSDVIMGAIEILVRLPPLAVGLAAGFGMFRLLGRRSRAVAIFYGLFMVWALYPIVARQFDLAILPPMPIYLAVALASLGLMSGYQIAAGSWSTRIVPMGLAIGLFLIVYAQSSINRGYFEQAYRFESDNVPAYCTNNRVLWLGTGAAVLNCPTSPHLVVRSENFRLHHQSLDAMAYNPDQPDARPAASDPAPAAEEATP